MAITLKPLKDQVIVITGASSGIGLVTARSAAARGARVMLVARSGAALGEIVRDINNAGGTADFREADVSDADAMVAVATDTVARFGRIDTWVNDAGVSIYAKLVDTPDDEHRRMFDTNYFGVVHGCLAAIPILRRSGGALITVASIASDLPSPIMGAYAASKHAVQGYIRSLRIELEGDGVPISVSLVKPSGIDTPIGQHAINHAGGEAKIPPPVYDPQLVADAILHCAEHPTRDLTVGGSGRLQALFAQHFPGLFEKLAPLAAKPLTDPDKAQPGPSNLWRGDAQPGRERSGEEAPLQHSLYTAAAKHPRATALVGVAGLATAAAVLFARRRA